MTPTTILVVEDERIIAKGIEKRLKGLGYAVAGLASTGEEGIQKATDLRPHLVLMDIHLGAGMDGVEAAGVIRRRVIIPVVYLTAHSDDATLQRAKLTEPFGYVLKPYEDNDLQTAIEIGLYKHQMERRLRENEQLLAATLGSIGDGVIATDQLGRVRFMNALAEQLTGWSQADALGRSVQEVFHIVGEKTRQPVRNSALAALETGELAELAPDSILIAKDEAERPIDESAILIRDVNGKVSGAVVVFRDITERRQFEAQRRGFIEMLQQRADFDSLTGLPNRTLFEDRLGQALAHARRTDRCVAILFLDLNGFKGINDRLGHGVGDQVLRTAAQRLKRSLREMDTAARLGGDEFAAVLVDPQGLNAAIVVAQRIMRAFDEPCELDGEQVELKTSIGISLYPSDGKDAETLVRKADEAMYRAKQKLSGYELYSPLPVV